MTDLIDLAARVGALDGACAETDALIALAAYEGRWPIASYGGQPINYDPALWMERHCFEPTASIDDAVMLVPEGWSFGAGKDDIIPGPTGWAWVSSDDDTNIVKAATPALALVSAALKARAHIKGE